MPYTALTPYAYPTAKAALGYAARGLATGYAAHRIKNWWRGRLKNRTSLVKRNRFTSGIRSPFALRRMFSNKTQVPPFMIRQFEWVHNGSVTTSATPLTCSATEFIYRLNSLFDPLQTGAGGQPNGLDQWALFYRRYRVLNCFVEIQFFSDETTAITCGAFSAQASNSTYTVANQSINEIEQLPGGGVRYLAPIGPQQSNAAFNVPIPKIEGIRGEFNDNDYSALFTADPTLGPVLRISGAAVGTAAQPEIYWRVKLTFTARLYDRINQLPS